MGCGWLKLSGIEASFSLMAAPYSQTELDAKAPVLVEFPGWFYPSGHPIGWGAPARVTLGIVVASSFSEKVIRGVIRAKSPRNTGFLEALWTTVRLLCEQPIIPN
jgi:hypothetical protein